MSTSYREYERLAWFYNRYWGREYPGAVMPVIENLLLPGLPAGAEILDLCCGTGHVAALVSRRGYRVIGIDGSAAMLTYANSNAPRALFFAADASCFALRHRADAVLSTFESINHFTAVDTLNLVFQRVGEALSAGGCFLFDLLTDEAYCREWGKSSAIVEEDSVCILRGGYDAAAGTAQAEVTAFRKDGGSWTRTDALVTEKLHSTAQVEAMLRKCGFRDVRIHDAASVGMAGPLSIGRIFLLAQR